MEPVTLVAGVAAATALGSIGVVNALARKVPPFTALVIRGPLGAHRARVGGTAVVVPGSEVIEVALTPRTAVWATGPAGELVIADGARLALELKVWFQVRASAQHVLNAWRALGARLLAANADELQGYLNANIAGAAAEVTRGWAADRLPPTATFRNEFLERLDWSFRDLGLAASELEVLRLEVTS